MYEITVKSYAIDRDKLARTEKRNEDLESTVENERFDNIKKEKQFNTTISKLKEAKGSVEA